MPNFDFFRQEVESPFAWFRLGVAVLLGSIGTVGMWSVPVVLPALQASFGAARAEASLPFTLAMLGFAFGGVLVGHLANSLRIAIAAVIQPSLIGCRRRAGAQRLLFPVHASAHQADEFGTLEQSCNLAIGFRGAAALRSALAASGNYLGGTNIGPGDTALVATEGWRATHLGVAAFCLITMLPLAAVLLPRPPEAKPSASHGIAAGSATLGLSPAALQVLLSWPASPAASRCRCRR